jgi:hypothetical protein
MLTFYDIRKGEVIPPRGLRGLTPVMVGDALLYQYRPLGYPSAIVSDVRLYDIGAGRGVAVTDTARHEVGHITSNGRFAAWESNMPEPLTLYDIPNNKYYVFDDEPNVFGTAVLGDWLIWRSWDDVDREKNIRCLSLKDFPASLDGAPGTAR